MTLSYCWGPTKVDGSHLTHSIRYDGNTVAVTANLYSALQHIRRLLDAGDLCLTSNDQPFRPPLWVDALSIDQNNVDERNEQVAKFWNIFGSAEQLLIWLGETAPGHEGEREVLELRRVLQRPSEAKEEHSRLMRDERLILRDEDDGPCTWNRVLQERRTPFRSPGPPERRAVRGASFRCAEHMWFGRFQENNANDRVAASITKEERSLVTKLAGLPWFKRRWVIQESLLSRKRWILYGQVLCDAEVFNGVLGLCNIPQDNTLSYGLRAHQSRVSFLGAMQAFNQHQCYDERDRVYALAHVSNDFRPAVDYRLTVEATYMSVAQELIRSGRSMELLACASSRTSSPSPLPSWVPDWREPVFFDSSTHRQAVTEALSCDQSQESWRKSSIDSGYATIKGDTLTLQCHVVRSCPSQKRSCERGQCLACDVLHSLEQAVIGLYREKQEVLDRYTGSSMSTNPPNGDPRKGVDFDAEDQGERFQRCVNHEKALAETTARIKNILSNADCDGKSMDPRPERIICIILTRFYQPVGFILERLPGYGNETENVPTYRLCRGAVLGNSRQSGLKNAVGKYPLQKVQVR